jgi:hypothetical protein
MTNLLQLDPAKRLTASQALLHPYFKSLVDLDLKLKEELSNECASGRINSDQEKVKNEKQKTSNPMVIKKTKQLVFPKNQSKPKNDNQVIKIANKENTMIIDQIEDDKSFIEKEQVYMEPKVKSKTT